MGKHLTLRRIQDQDRTEAVELMHTLRISLGGLQDRSLYRAMCSSAEICCVVARNEQELGGIALVELNRNWIRRRPVLAARMVLARLRHKRSPGTSNPTSPATAAPGIPLAQNPPMRWSDRAPRVLFIGVDPAWRGQGVGKRLYEAMFDEIRALGETCILARVALDNFASLHLHNETGWVLYKDADVVFAIKDLQPARSHA